MNELKNVVIRFIGTRGHIQADMVLVGIKFQKAAMITYNRHIFRVQMFNGKTEAFS